MVRTPWSRLASSSFFSLVRRFIAQRMNRARRPRRRRLPWAFGPITVAAEVCEARQMLSAAIAAVSPNSAQVGSSGVTINIMGSGFSGGVTGIMFGDTQSTSFQVLSDSAISTVAPSHAAGTVDIRVMAMMGNSPVDPQHDQFTYLQSGPQVTGVAPNAGSTSGGVSVSITGSGFSQVSGVMFGTTTASSFTVNSPTSITAIAPGHSAGNVDVIIVTATGNSPVDPQHDQFTYSQTGPAVTSVSPGTGSASGGTSVTIQGTGFTGVTGVTFGGTAAASFVVNSATSITAVSPVHTSGTVDIQVVTGSGTSAVAAGDQFVYLAPVYPPTISGLTTSSGPVTGGTSVTIAGTNFTNVTGVSFGTTAARSFTVNSSTSITAVTEAEGAGTVDIFVTNSAGTSAATSADRFTFQSSAPAVTALSVASGSTAGGTSVVIYGTNFLGVSTVSFGGVAAQSFSLNSPTSITAVSPAESAGVVDITVQTPNGTSATGAADRFTFAVPPPQVTGLSKVHGSTAGGDTVTISGNNFGGVTGVSFGGVAAASFALNADGSISAVTPTRAAGDVDVTVTTPAGASAATLVDRFSFVEASLLPSIAALDTSGGTTAGGTTVTISGANFSDVAAVRFGSAAAASFTVDSSGSITTVAPAHAAGVVDVTVETALGVSAITAADRFTYSLPVSAPVVTSLGETEGSINGGNVVTITGTDFSDVRSVLFGETAATMFLVQSATQIMAVTPAHAVGTVDVVITTGSGTSAVSPADAFTFASQPVIPNSAGDDGPPPAPGITGLDVTHGSTAGGAQVTIRGDHLDNATAVYFGAVAADSYAMNLDGSITAVAPAQAAGVVDVVVTTFDGTSVVTAADQFTYDILPPAPTVTGLSVSSGSSTGGARVTISGTDFREVTGVWFGDVEAQSFTVNADGTITAIAPTESEGTVDVKVVNTGGTSAVSALDQFTFRRDVPIVTGLSAPSGFTTGGEQITIYGLHLAGVTGVSFVVPPSGGQPAVSIAAASFTVNPDRTITAVTPAAIAGPVDVIVTTAAGTSAANRSDTYTYTPAGALPTITRLNVGGGSTAGGQAVIISGTNFTGVTGVYFGNAAATSFVVSSPTSILAVAPAGEAATVDVNVVTAAGSSVAGPAGRYSFYDPFASTPSQGGAGGGVSPGNNDSFAADFSAADNDLLDSLTLAPPPAGPADNPFAGAPADWGNGPSYVVNQHVEDGFMGGHGVEGLFGADVMIDYEFTTIGANRFAFPIQLVNNPVSSSAGGVYTISDHGTRTWSRDEAVINADGSVTTYDDLATVMFETVETHTVAPANPADAGTTPSVDTFHELVICTWNIHEILLMPNGTGFDKSGHGNGVIVYNSFLRNGTGEYHATNEGQGSENIHQIGVSLAQAHDHLDFTDTGYLSWMRNVDGTLAAGIMTENGSSSDLRFGTYIHDTKDVERTGDSTGSGPFQRSIDAVNVIGTDNLMTSDEYSSTKNSSNLLLAYHDTATKTGGGRDRYTGRHHVDEKTITTPGTGDDSPGPLTHIEHDDTQTTGNDGYSINERKDSVLETNGSIFTADNHDDRDWGRSEALTFNNGTNDISTSDAAGNSTTAHDEFTFSDDDIQNYGDSDVETESIPSATAVFDSTSSAADGGGDDDFKTIDDDNDKFSDSDRAAITIISVDEHGVVTRVVLTDGMGDKGTVGAHVEFEDDETLPTRSSAEKDHFTLHEKARVNDKFAEKGRIDITIDSPENELADEIHVVESLTFADAVKAGEIVSDDGTEDTVGQISNAPASSDIEGDTFRDKSDVTDHLVLNVSLHAVEKKTAADGTITFTGVDKWFKDDITEEEKDGLIDKHTKNGSSSQGGGGSSGNGSYPNEDDIKFDDIFSDKVIASGTGSLNVSVYGPIPHGIAYNSYTVGFDFDGTESESDDDHGEDIIDSADAPPDESSVNGSDDEHDTETDDSDARIDGHQFVMTTNNRTITDPVTGVPTTINSSNCDYDTFDAKEKDHFVDKHTVGQAFQPDASGNSTSISSSASTDDITENAAVQSFDSVLEMGDIDITITGSPSAGVTETYHTTIIENGLEGFWDADVDQFHDANSSRTGFSSGTGDSSASDSDNETDVESGGVGGHNKLGITSNSSVITVDPVTGLTTTNTSTDGGTILLGEYQPGRSKDVHTGAGPMNPIGSGEDDIETHLSDDESLDGTNTAGNSTTVTGTMPDGTTVTSTQTLGSKVKDVADTYDNKDTTGTEHQTNGHLSSETSRTVDKASDHIGATDEETETLQATIRAVDPATGLTVTFQIIDQTGDTITDTDDGRGTDISTSNATDIDPNVAPTPTTTDTKSGEDHIAEHETSSDHCKLKVSIRGNWSENDSVDLTEIVTLDDWETDDKSDDLLQQEDTPGTEQIHDHDEFSARMVDFAKGSISFIDHDTGVRTTVTLNSLVTESGNDIQDRSGPAPGSSNESDRSSWNLQTTITKTNTDGSAAAAPITRSENGSEAHHRINGVLGEPGNDNGSNTNPAAVVPSVSGIAAAGGSTARGSVEGGDVVRITGTGFTSDSQVWFDGTAAAESITISPTEIIAISPGHATGTVRVAVNNGAGTSAESEADKFDFATVDADHSSPNGGSSGSNGPDEGWFSGAWGRIKATAKRLDQFGGQINTFMLTGSWVDKEAASGLRNLKESLLGIGDGAIVFTDAISFGNIEATHREAVRAQQEAAFRGDFWSNAGFYSAKVGAKTIHAIVVVSGVAYVAGGVVYFVPGAAGTLTVAGNAAQPVILVLSADAAYNNGVAAYYDYQNGDLIDMTEHAAEGTVWAAFAGDSAKSSATLLKSIEFKPSNGRLVQEVWLHAEGKCGGASNLGPEKHAYAKKLLDRYQRMYGDRGLSTEVRYVNQQLWRPGMSTNHSVILDVVEGNLVKPKAVYDYKFGKKGLTDPRIAEIRRVCGFDEDIPIFLAP